jgi:hypothetical protein
MHGCSFLRRKGRRLVLSRSCLEVEERKARRCHTSNPQ